MKEKRQKPEWAPEKADQSFASSVMEGVEGGHDGMTRKGQTQKKSTIKRKQLEVADYVAGVLANDRTILARTITLIESNAPRHLDLAQNVLQQVLPKTGNAIRIGITGVPGAGKSTFIDTFGTYLCQQGHRVAVLAVDPSSSLSRGSILGDKTRMEQLTQQKNCFVRPSPSGGTLGGVNRKTRETLLICEAAGYDVILVETVGVGQSEAIVSTMVDFFLLLTLTGAGDELQSFKKGVIEMADAILINKADGDNKLKAQQTCQEFNQALHYLKPAREEWTTQAYCCSALTGEGVEAVWKIIQSFQKQTQMSGAFANKRREQSVNWMNDLILEQIRQMFYQHPEIKKEIKIEELNVAEGKTPVTTAVERLLKRFGDLREGEIPL